MNIIRHLFTLLIITTSAMPQAKPFVPQDDTQVLERLPEQLFNSASSAKISEFRTRLKSNPQDWLSASQLARHYIDLSKAQADPRYMGYAQSILKPFWQLPEPPGQALILRAIIRQNAHDFKGALDDLQQILSVQPGHIQANLIKSTIATVQGDYQIAIQHCRQLIRRSSMILALICQSTPVSLSGKAETSYRLLNQVLSVATPMPEKEQVWAWTVLAEIAWRLGKFKAADQHFQTAMKIDTKDMYLRRVYADFLLHQHRPDEVVQLIDTNTQVDSLLLRLTLAEQMTGSEELPKHMAILKQRFEANQKRGSTLHQGDEARFNLHLLNQPNKALHLAKKNWQLQRESTDLYILLQSAIAANDSQTIQQIESWLAEKGTEDKLVNQMLVTREGKDYEI